MLPSAIRPIFRLGPLNQLTRGSWLGHVLKNCEKKSKYQKTQIVSAQNEASKCCFMSRIKLWAENRIKTGIIFPLLCTLVSPDETLLGCQIVIILPAIG